MRYRSRSAVLPLVIANVVCFFLQQIISGFTEYFMLVSSDVFFRPWILVSAMFLHGSFNHLFFNMYALLMFGPLVEQRIGRNNFLIAYFVSGLLASVISVPFYSSALGASGAIMGIMGITIMLFPDMKVLFFFVIPMSLRTAGIVMAALDILGIFVPSGIANVAHLGGLGAGLLFGYWFMKKKVYVARPVRKRVVRTRRHNIELDDEDINNYFRYGRI